MRVIGDKSREKLNLKKNGKVEGITGQTLNFVNRPTRNTKILICFKSAQKILKLIYLTINEPPITNIYLFLLISGVVVVKTKLKVTRTSRYTFSAGRRCIANIARG